MSNCQGIQTFNASSFNNNSYDTLLKKYYNSNEKQNYFFQYETEEFYDDEIACKANIWRRHYFSFLEKKLNEIEYE